ncbi:MAG: DNA mismatch repair protein MutS [Candidatus Nanoarchaeia archaeon]
MTEGIRITPMMQQFLDIKQQHPDCILFFRAGDFYELFYEDAKECAQILNITLTKRGDVPMAGVPFHSVNPYIKKVLEANRKIAICEQLEDPKQAKGVVKRGVTQILTPGTIIEDEYLSNETANYIASISLPNSKQEGFGVILVDISTGECIAKECTQFSDVKALLQAYHITEVLYPEHPFQHIIQSYTATHSIYSSSITMQRFHKLFAQEIIKKQYPQSDFISKLQTLPKCIEALGAVLYYSKILKQQELNHIQNIYTHKSSQSMILESLTLNNLDIIKSQSSNSTNATLLGGIDYTKTPMGRRELRKQLISPLLSTELITKRHDAIEEILTNASHSLTSLQETLSNVSDIERILTRITTHIATPKDIVALCSSLQATTHIATKLEQSNIFSYFQTMNNIEEIISYINSALVEEPPSHLRDGGIIKRGFSNEKDELEEMAQNSSSYLVELEQELKQESGIQSLKIKYNKIFGYYIEIPKSQEHNVPQECILKQTLVNANRYTTPELKEKEQLILGAKEKLVIIEQELFHQIVLKLQEYSSQIRSVIESIKSLDIALSGAYLAMHRNYVRPTFTNEQTHVVDGRNPIVERFVTTYVSNSYSFEENDLCKIITGPNMAGKSTFLRQVALISILAQCGQYVPATSAQLKLYDGIFTRIGAHDELAENQSTFMVEMSESAHILNTATQNSLVIFDEIGRGTSTYDGMAIAQSIIEYIAQLKTHTLFATHYHELNSLEREFEHICNYHVEVDENNSTIEFLHKIKKGGMDKSYGVHVAKLAKMPQSVLKRAEEILHSLEKKE